MKANPPAQVVAAIAPKPPEGSMSPGDSGTGGVVLPNEGDTEMMEISGTGGVVLPSEGDTEMMEIS